MSLEFLTKETGLVEAEAKKPENTVEPIIVEATDESQGRHRSKVLFCLLGAAILLMLNVVYNFSVAQKGTPILQTIMKNPVFDFAGAGKENPLRRKEAISSVGVVAGILHNENNPTALIGIKLLHEGEVISGAKIIKIHKDRVEFERDGFSWTQHIMEKAKPE